MKNLIISLTALFFTVFISADLFAANRNKGDWGFEPKNYNYALIEFEIISVDHGKAILRVFEEGKNEDNNDNR